MIDAEIQKKITFSRSQGSAPTSDDRQKTIKVQKKINFHMCANHHHPQSPKKDQLFKLARIATHTKSKKRSKKDQLSDARKSRHITTTTKVQKKINFVDALGNWQRQSPKKDQLSQTYKHHRFQRNHKVQKKIEKKSTYYSKKADSVNYWEISGC